MSLFLIVAILVLGFLLIMFELFIIPGATVTGILGAITIIVGIVLCYVYLGGSTGHKALAASLLATGGLIFFAYKTLGSSSLSLERDLQESKVNEFAEDLNVVVGDTGIAFGDIKPTGKAVINKKVLPVYSMGEFISDNATIEVIKINSSKITVRMIG